MSSSNNTIRLLGAGGTARHVTTTAAASDMTDTSFTVDVDEVRRVLGSLGKKSTSTVPPPPPPANMSTSKEKAVKRKTVSDKKKKTRREVKSQKKASKY